MIRVNLSRVSSNFKNSLKNMKDKVTEIDSMIKNTPKDDIATR